MYSNLVKWGNANLQESEKRVIDTNELAERRISELAEKMRLSENAALADDNAEDGFISGLSAEEVDGLLSDPDAPEGEEGTSGNVIKAKAREDIEAMLSEARAEAQAILAQAREQADAEVQSMRSQAQEQIAAEREEAHAAAMENGYAEGYQKAEREFREQSLALEREYQEIMEDLEPQFIETITGIYEHIFHVELSSYRDILVYLISSTMRRIEGSRHFMVHVSKDDYPYVSMHKKQISENMMTPNSEMDIVEDITLGQNECLIETEGGIFDCGLGTQMEELIRHLKLLSYEKTDN